MPYAITFDTLAFVRKLEGSGIILQQSEAIVETVAEIMDHKLNDVATKSDVNLLKQDINFLESKLENKLENLENKFEAKLSALKSEIIMWAVSLVFAQTAVLSVIKFMH